MKFKNFIVFSLIISILSAFPVYAADKVEEDIMVIEYDDIEDMVLENNINLEIAKYSIENLEDARDEEREAIRQASELGMTAFTSITNGQINLLRLNRDQIEKSQIYTAKSFFIALHQLSNNIKQLELNKASMEEQLQINKIRYDLGLITESVLNSLETSIKETDVTYNTLINSRDSNEIQFKNILDISSSKEIKLGEIPNVSIDYIESIDLKKGYRFSSQKLYKFTNTETKIKVIVVRTAK